jgi:RNA polymerase sigma-70 factor (ECF subfamily)
MAEEGERRQESLWVLLAQSGDKEALDRLLESAQERLYAYIVHLVRDRHLAEDVLQEVFLRIYRKLKWLREPALFRSWAYQIATRESFRRLERERIWKDQIRDDALLDTLAAPAPAAALDEELRAGLPASLAKLSPASRAVIVLYYLHEMSFVETAAVLEIPIGTVKSRLAYGLAKLREQRPS